MTRRRASWITTIVMVPLACLVAMPFYYILVNTFKTQADMSVNPLGLPKHATFENYVNIFANTNVIQAFFNTFYVTAVSVVVMVLVGALASYAMLKRNTKVHTVVSALLLIGFLAPFQVTIIPLYQMFIGAHLADSLTGLIAIYTAGAVFCYFLIIGYMRTLPGEVFEAARIDGAGPYRIFLRIALPLIRPVLITVAVFQTMWVWNDYISPSIFLSSPQKSTLVLLAFQAVSQFTVNWPAFMTVTVIVLIPMVVFFLAMQRYIVDGLVAGSVKG